jgi:hypothetical protein
MPFLTEQAFPRLLGVPKKKFRRRPQEESHLMSPNLTHFLEMFDSICWTLVGLYVCFVFQFLMVLAFHVYIHRRSSTSDIDILIKPAISPGDFPLILLSNLGTRFLLRGVDCNTPGVY